MPNLAQRSFDAELIDDFSLSNDALAQNLKELAFINKWLGGNMITISALKTLFAKYPQPKYHIADIGSGGGDMLLLMAKYCQKNKILAQFTGIDANHFMVEYAKNICQNFNNINLDQCNIFDEAFAKKTFDIASLTLFCHHFKAIDLVKLMGTLKQNCKFGFVINDLHRNGIAYYSIWLLTALFSKSYLVKNDARLSVWRGFKKQELVEILRAAGLQNFEISWCWAFRWRVVVYL